MKARNKNPFSKLDERNKQIAGKIMAVMYLLTILAMQGIILYRQLVLGQDWSDFRDLAILMTFNSLFLVSALLYYGAVQVRTLKLKSILLIYFILILLGSLFTYARYNLFREEGISWEQLWEKLWIIYIVTGIILGFFILFSVLGNRRMKKEIE